MASKNFFVGFGTMEDWAAAIDQGQPVNAESVTETTAANKRYNLTRCTQLLLVSQVCGAEVLYCRKLTGAFLSADGGLHPMGDDLKKIIDRERSAWDVLVGWLEEQGLVYRRAMVALPTKMKLLDGNAGFLAYDQARDIWIRSADALMGTTK